MVNRLLQRRNFPHPLQNGFDFLMPTFRSIYEGLAIQSIAETARTSLGSAGVDPRYGLGSGVSGLSPPAPLTVPLGLPDWPLWHQSTS
jgi:hypothetical protein